ncbi:MAG TPA: DUF4231 domain-containing protein [Solirubrobacterales bacterium]|nr:DUF4231 domain-containing protein [Solirubrobacterales bacterium]
MTAVELKIEDHLPEAYAVASRASARGQREFRQLTRASLLLLIVAAVGGAIAPTWGGWVSAAAFLASIVLTALAIYWKTEQDWYDGRASAESVKSLGFKYAIGGEPLGATDPDADGRFAEALAALTSELRALSSTVVPAPGGPVLGALRELRARPLAERRAAYREQRIEEQRAWYSRRAREHRATARRWRAVMFAGQAAGVAGAALKGLGVLDVDLLSIFATLAAATAAWIAAGDFTETARAYDFALLDLGQALEGVDRAESEEEWARFVADCEQAMSREHTMWLARRRVH